ncbi:MAG: hypothetical protein ABR517_08325, partial [Thermoanaerobaculia bacterium]
MAAVMTKEPDLTTLPATTPSDVRWLLDRCLRKDPRTRWPDIGAARLVLQDVLAGRGIEAEAPRATGEIQSAPPRRALERWGWVVLVILVLAATAIAFRFFPRASDAPEARPW